MNRLLIAAVLMYVAVCLVLVWPLKAALDAWNKPDAH